MPVQTQKDLFLHELGDIYDAEQRITNILPEMAKEAQDPDIKKAFEQHLTETKQQINNIEQCFKVLGVQPKTFPCLAIDGLNKEHDTFMREQPSAEILSMYDLEATVKTEHYEIASYQGLIDTAVTLGQQQCAQLLKQNLDQEEVMAEKMVLFARQIGKQMSGQVSRDIDVSDIE
jgi:ferritin-like metal-binding protein YciE